MTIKVKIHRPGASLSCQEIVFIPQELNLSPGRSIGPSPGHWIYLLGTGSISQALVYLPGVLLVTSPGHWIYLPGTGSISQALVLSPGAGLSSQRHAANVTSGSIVQGQLDQHESHGLPDIEELHDERTTRPLTYCMLLGE